MDASAPGRLKGYQRVRPTADPNRHRIAPWIQEGLAMTFRLAVLFCALGSLMVASASNAQQLEVGVGVSTLCRGSDGSICSEDRAVPLSAHVSGLFDDRFELGFRVSRGAFDNQSFTISRGEDARFGPDSPDRVTVFTEDRSIRYLTGQALYHFRRGRRVRPVLGLGLGSLMLPRSNRCEPAGCEPTMQRLLAPPERTTRPDVAIVIGASVHASKRVVFRGGWQAHNLGGEELSSVEWFLAAGWRFGG
jgi:hypothetical protein